MKKIYRYVYIIMMFMLIFPLSNYNTAKASDDIGNPTKIKFNKKYKSEVGNQDEKYYTLSLDKKTKIAITLSSTSKIETPGYLQLYITKDEDFYDFDEDFYDFQDIFFPYKTKKTIYYTLKPGDYDINISNELTGGYKEIKYGYTMQINTVTSNIDVYELDETKLSTRVGSKHQLLLMNDKAVVNNKNITWASSDESIAVVSSKGVVKGKKAGKCTIKVKIKGGKTKICEVTVGKPSLETKLASNPVYAFVSYVDDDVIYNDCCIEVYNNSLKNIVHIEYEIIQYNSRKQYIDSPYGTYYCDDTLFANQNDDYVFYVNNDARFARICIKNATYEDGTVWNNPYYKTWHKTYYKKNMK